MKKFFTLAFLLACAITSNAQTITLSGGKDKLSDVVLVAGSTVSVYIYVEGVSEQTGLQADLYLPDGVSITKKTNGPLVLDEEGETTHSCTYDKREDGYYRILVFDATNNSKFHGDKGAIMRLTLAADAAFTYGEAYFKNVLFIDPQYEETIIDDSALPKIPVYEDTASKPSAVDEVSSELDTNAPVYTLQGVEATDGQTGILIQNGKKFVVE